MKAKLTLSVDKELVQFAHQQARTQSKSVSRMFSDYLNERRDQTGTGLSPSVAEMVGSLKGYNLADDKVSIRSAYAQKHLH